MSSIARLDAIHRRIPSVLVLLALLLSLDVAAAGLDAHLDRTRVAEGETVVLTLTTPGDAGGTPDPAPLQSDFDLLDQSQSTRMSIVNGRSSTTREWQWVLTPKRTGKLTIPPLHLGASASSPLVLEVLPAAQSAKLGEARPVLLEVEAKPNQPYVQGQVVYSLRVLSRVPLRHASLSDPRAGDAIVERLGEDKHYSAYRNGEEYQVIERRYALFPQHSGKLQIAAPVLSAQIPEQGKRHGGLGEHLFGRSPFADMEGLFGSDPFAGIGGVFEQTRPVRVHGRDLTLQVQARPADAISQSAGGTSPWLPAESLTLTESWSPDPPVFRVGEPVTRTLTITAQGLTAAQLPNLQPSVPAGVKIYPDKAQDEIRPQGDTLMAQKIIKSALVPSQAGKLTLPEVRLAWWDTKTNKPQVASLPERSVEVLPAVAGVSATSFAAGSASAEPIAEPALPAAEVGPVAPVSADTGGGTDLSNLGEALTGESRVTAGYWPWVAAAFALAWLATAVLWLRARRGGRVPAAAAPPAPPDLSKARAQLKTACSAGDARVARQALLYWAAARWPLDPPRRLETLAWRLNGDAAEVLRELDRGLYAGAEPPWDGASAWRRLAPSLGKEPREQAGSGQHSPLPPLYPQHA